MNLYTRQQVYQLDQLAIQQDGQPGLQLMQKAADAVWRAIQKRWPEVNHIVVLAGSGNNGGDAFALAILAKNNGVTVEILTLGDLTHQSPESEFYRQQWLQTGGQVEPWAGACPDCDLIVDGLLGIGLNKSLSSEWQAMVRQINAQKAPKVCIDIPSGLNANTGNAMPCAIQANLTVSFIGRKVGCFVADGPDYCAELEFDDLGLSSSAMRQVDAVVQVLDETGIRLPAVRKNNSHKNQYGHVVVVGGNRGMSGAARLAGMAALRAGAGLVSLCVHPQNIPVSTSAELMVSDWNDLAALLERASVIVVGPGLGRCEQAAKVLQQLASIDKPMLIDADALDAKFISSLATKSAVLTPHPGEAARLLNKMTVGIQQDRIEALQQMMKKWQAVSVLKGAGTLVGQRDVPITLCSHGHSGMATAGMGDVLSGLIGAYLAQGLEPLQAAQIGVLVHALAAEEYALTFDANSLIASDVIDRIAVVTRRIQQLQTGC